jgi:hypothetical protein
LYVSAVLLVVWLLFPTTDVVSPDWSVLVTDTSGSPLQGSSVTVMSQQYTLESRDVEETKSTGDDGRAHFDERRIRAIGLVRVLGVLRNLGQGVHASFGIHTHFVANKAGYGYPTKLELFSQNERESTAHGSAQQHSHVILMKCPPGYAGFGCDFPDDPDQPILPLQR